MRVSRARRLSEGVSRERGGGEGQRSILQHNYLCLVLSHTADCFLNLLYSILFWTVGLLHSIVYFSSHKFIITI